jgi:K(+)-stimulated pyrophosphate-energized sodium pump
MMSFLFCGLTMNAVGRAAQSMVTEVRRQFREIKGILTREATPDYARCVEISTKGAQREMLLPSLVAIIVPILVGVILGPAGVMGLLIGGLGSGFVLAVFMSNSGGAWDNAKKYVEEGHLGGKNSEAHKATVTGDTVGDPFKDTSGPSLNILIKLMSMVAIVMAMLTVAIHSGVELPAAEEPAVAEEAAVVEEATVVEESQSADGALDFNDAESEIEQQVQ